MSLFENDRYRWRETYFVLFNEKNRPTAKQVEKDLKKLGSRYEISDIRTDDKNQFESLTMTSPADFAAMDVTYISGEEVTEQVKEFSSEIKNTTLTEEEIKKVAKLPQCNARFDVFHFEEVVDDEEDEVLDPGALLIVLEHLANLCDGVCIDPQSGSVL
jgi:hypothetical protein